MWIYFSKKRLVRGHGWSCVDSTGTEGVLVSKVICVYDSASDVPSKGSSWDIGAGCMIGVVIDEAELGLGYV